jgi:hypothetical protein
MSWLPRPAFLAAPSRESGSKSAGYRASEGLGFRRTEHIAKFSVALCPMGHGPGTFRGMEATT